ncbi:S-layer homology domain-containing protein [Paenibacillus sp. N1-5-1-14]|uniref:S-layer homology domain-containing protein n=1 Tax=Paenibacillus radicibacter TaxID=2972488 RepID=UPI00215923D6|nr:S-layer homology domain-containing protein [Paenibacillus radicibacter]MCR8645598.1 S-layer homology domain-containing protein [Paenibacillus radicibacter]
MKKIKNAFIMLFIACLMFTSAGQIVKAAEVKPTVTPDGRIQIVMDFNDMKDAEWAAGYIGKMKSKNVLSGFEDGSFRPNQPVTRVQAVVTAVRLMGLDNEAKAKSLDTKLHFKDAALIDNQYKWAKGYILVALEKGLFDTTEESLQPEKPASRVWVSSLLVKSLGLQTEALQKMTVIPGFYDANQIPAGAVGYINVAVDRDIISGYPDNSFQPNKPVSRAEMAVLLDKTNDGMLENAGAIKVSGKITGIKFDTTPTASQPSNGRITIKTYNGDTVTYTIASNLLVQYYQKFILADQLAVNDVITVTVKDNVVSEAMIYNKDDVKDTEFGIRELEIEVEYDKRSEYKLKYKNKGNKVEAYIESRTEKGKDKQTDAQAVKTIENLLQTAALTDKMSKDEVASKVMAALQLDKNKIQELEIKIKFANGKEIKVDIDHDDKKDDHKGYDRDNDDDHDNHKDRNNHKK